MTSYPTDDSMVHLARKHSHMLLCGSGIDPGVISERGYRTASSRTELLDFKKYQRRPGLVIPVSSPSGATGRRLRPDQPRKGKDGKPRKYEQPGETPNMLDVHPRNVAALGDAGVDLWITEGEKKADSLTSRGLCTVALFGVWGWCVKGTKARKLLPCWDHIRLDGRRIYVVFDSDVMFKEGVQLALERLVAALEARGAEVLVVYLAGPEKGVDDYLVAGGTVNELKMLARKFVPEDLGRVRLSKDERLRAAVGDLWLRWWSHDWGRMVGTGEKPNSMRGHTARDVLKALIDAAAKHGKVKEGAVEVRMSTRTLALEGKTSRPSAMKATRNLEADNLIEIIEPKSKDEARTYRLLTPRATLYHDGSKAAPEGNVTQGLQAYDPGGKGLRAPRLRWSSPGRKARRGMDKATRRVRDNLQPAIPGVRQLGKVRGAILDALDAAGGTATLAELCEVLRKSRPRDLRRRTLPMLEGDGILIVEGDTATLAEDWRERLDQVREFAGEIEAEERDTERYRLQREAFHHRGENLPDQHYANVGADGHIEELRSDEPEVSVDRGQEDHVSPLAAAIRSYLDRYPHDACQPPGWIGVTLWAHDLYADKPTPAETRAAIDELGGERYLRESLEHSREVA